MSHDNLFILFIIYLFHITAGTRQTAWAVIINRAHAVSCKSEKLMFFIYLELLITFMGKCGV